MVSIAPDNASISYSDYCAVAVDNTRARFTRPIIDGQGYETTNPAARVRFVCNARSIVVRLRYTALVTRMDTYNGDGVILADGVLVGTFSSSAIPGVAADTNVYLSFATATPRTIEIIFPYSASVDFLGLSVPVDSLVSAAPGRPVTRLVVFGDSITHGFVASRVDKSWPYLLAKTKGWQLVNNGYGSRQCIDSDGATAAALAPDIATYLIGYNNFYPQTPLSAFKASFKAVLTGFHSARPATKLYCITPTWTPNSFGALTIENYRQQVRDAITEIGSSLNVLAEGASIATGNVAHFPDNVHPNDLGASEIATNLASIVSM